MADFLPLSTLLATGRPPEFPVFLHKGTIITWADFSADIRQLMEQINDYPGQRWLLVCEDSYYFTVGLFALILSNKAIILPANAQAGTLAGMQGQVDGFMSDRELPQPHLRITRSGSTATFPGRTLDLRQIMLTLFTSGTTGIPTAVTKNLVCIEMEIAMLQQVARARLPGNLVISSVPYYHAYGIIFQLLWPLCIGMLIITERVRYGEELLSYLQHYEVNFISSPAFLRRWVTLWQLVPPLKTLRSVISAGGILPEPVLQAFAAPPNIPLWEIYGSTETGVVASRCHPEPAWQPFPSVTVIAQPDQRIKVVSPYVAEGSCIIGDRVNMQENGRFTLAGRADTILKIEEKRFSTQEMAWRCQELGWFEEVRFVALHTASRQMLGAVAVLNESGRVMLATQGKPVFVTAIKNHLAHYFERVVLPRKWRFVDDFPRNDIGKVLYADLMELF